jgi:hypothetical protein
MKDEDEVLIYDRMKAMILELDSLTNISQSEFSEDFEDVVSVEINSFSGGLNKKLVRLPKTKRQEIFAIENTMRETLSSDNAINIAALSNLLNELLSK